ncbi:MAG: hypothetical protein KKB20_12995 [Proteobacteria bacterium]|nr:hypothetical protein [Pseudomonadota bacterium]
MRIELAEVDPETRDELPPGRCLRLMVLDIGHVMDDRTLDRVFEPCLRPNSRARARVWAWPW